jgi:hypothetical protein
VIHMKNYGVLLLLVGLTAGVLHASTPYDEYSDIKPWTTAREKKIKRMEDKRNMEWHYSRSHEPKAPSNIKLWDFEKLQDSSGYPKYIFQDFGVDGGSYGDPEYFYQKPGVDKQGKPYPRYTLTPYASQADIRAEIERRHSYDKKQRRKINYWTQDVIGRWLERKRHPNRQYYR